MRTRMVAVESGFTSEVKVKNVSESRTEGGRINHENASEEKTNTGSCFSAGTAIINTDNVPCLDNSFFRHKVTSTT